MKDVIHNDVIINDALFTTNYYFNKKKFIPLVKVKEIIKKIENSPLPIL